MKMLTAVFCLTIASLACGTQLPTSPSYNGATITQEPTAQTVNMSVSEPTDTPPVYMTTGALNVRAEANASSEILGTLAPYTEITIYVLDVQGDDCYGGEWYAISAPIEGFVCSLWVVKK